MSVRKIKVAGVSDIFVDEREDGVSIEQVNYTDFYSNNTNAYTTIFSAPIVAAAGDKFWITVMGIVSLNNFSDDNVAALLGIGVDNATLASTISAAQFLIANPPSFTGVTVPFSMSVMVEPATGAHTIFVGAINQGVNTTVDIGGGVVRMQIVKFPA